MHYHIAAAAKSLTKGLALDFHLLRLSSHLTIVASWPQLERSAMLINEVQSRDKQLTPRDHTRASIRSTDHNGQSVWQAVEQGKKNVALSVNIFVTLVYLLIF